MKSPNGMHGLPFTLCQRATSHSDFPPLRQLYRVARWCWAISPVSAKCGTMPPYSFIRTNSAALHGAIEALIGSPALRNEMSRRSYERARKFSADLMTDRYLSMYQAVAYGKALCVS